MRGKISGRRRRYRQLTNKSTTVKEAMVESGTDSGIVEGVIEQEMAQAFPVVACFLFAAAGSLS